MKPLFSVKKISLVLVFAILAAVFITACGGNSDGPGCADILLSVMESDSGNYLDTKACYGEKIYDDSFSSMYSIDKSMIDDGAICYKAEGGLADEISIVHVKSSSDVSLSKEKLHDRIALRANAFSGYKPEELYKVENAIISSQGNYVYLIIAEDAAILETEIRRAISK